VRGTPAGFAVAVARDSAAVPASFVAEALSQEIPGAAEFFATLDGTVLAGFSARHVWRRVNVSLGYEDVVPLVGTVTVEESLDDPIPTASFEILSDRVAQHDPASWGYGDQDVAITFYAGTKPASLTAWLAFTGWTDSRSNAGLYKARGPFRCVGSAAAWAGNPGCIRVGPFRGLTRGALLAAYVTSTGGTILNPDILSLGAVVSRPVEINGPTALEVARRFGEIERWLPRVTAEGALELVTFDSILTDEPVFAFTPATYLSCEEQPVESPATKRVLSGSCIPDSIRLTSGGTETKRTEVPGVDAAGLPTLTITDTTTNAGIVTGVRTELRQTFARDGVTAEPATLQTYSVVEEKWVYAYADLGDGISRPTTQLLQHEKHTWMVTGVPCATAYGLGNLWLSGGRFVGDRASLIEVGRTIDENTWNGASAAVSACTLATENRMEWALYSKLAGTFGGYIYPDGAERLEQMYALQVIRQDLVTWRDLRDAQVPEVQKTSLISTIQVDTVTGQEFLIQGTRRHETWVMIAGGATHLHRVTGSTLALGLILWGAPGGYRQETTLVPVDEILAGPLLGPPVGSLDAALLRQTVEVHVFDASGILPFLPLKESDTIEWAETPAELDRVAAWRMLLSLCDKVVIRHRLLPFLRIGQVVTVTSAPRSLTARRSIVWSTKRAVMLPDQASSQETLVYVLPEA
jgi:hypothetical protein